MVLSLMPSPKKSRIHRRVLLSSLRLHHETSSRGHKPREKSENMHLMRTHNLKQMMSMNSTFCEFCDFYNKTRKTCEHPGAKTYIALLDACPRTYQSLLDGYIPGKGA